ncbi:SDR family NAD(P)-dependent oxidoreductase [Nocardia aurantia]|uniref:Short-chain dehydrogenase n=1 Tax=Nocardia aurantia TaxID=2585199 RepID=A0A7K0DJC8_9NOCA|nr:SDR family NAD(P)-dependent oxidoreductase [Nocardia aurantia]MQY25913.1 hypothetical protein [Nocardia aurantia]
MFAGRGAIVVGGGSGVGLAVATALAAHGAGVVINSRSAEAVDRATETITGTGGSAVGVAGSAADESVADRLVETCESAYGAVDVLVNCAGVAEPHGSSILSVTTAQWRDLLDSHLTTTFNTCRRVAPRMAARGMTMQASLAAPPPEYAAALYVYLAADASAAVSGEIFIAAGGFVGRFARPATVPLGYRDHANQPPWSVDELGRMIG